MRNILILASIFVAAVSAADYSIVFVHLGDTIPEYAYTSMAQARLFNDEADIYLVANAVALQKAEQQILAQNNVIPVSCESLPQSNKHKKFMKKSTLDNRGLNGFWRKTCERFFYVEELVHFKGLSNVFHLENDIMLYCNLKDQLPIFQTYAGIATTFDSDDRCIPGIMYIKEWKPLRKMMNYFTATASQGRFDMHVIALFKKQYGTRFIGSLPIITREYVQNNIMCSTDGRTLENKYDCCNKCEQFNCVFDAAALGQYLGGIHHVSGNAGPGFINEGSVFNPALCTYTWELDSKGRKVPYMIYNDKKCLIANLHIHSKKLYEFMSL